MPRKRKKCWSADALCRLDSSLTPQYDSAPGLGSPETLIPRDEESSEEDRPFLPRFLLQKTISAHSPYDGVFHNRRESPVPIRLASLRELAAFPRCRVCEHLRAVERPSARRSLPAPVLLDEFRWQSDPVLWSRAWAEQPAPAPGAQTVSTTQIWTAGNGVGKRRQNGRKAAPRLVGAPLLRARVNMVTAGRRAKNPLAKHPKSD